jgi:hypothetical protein
LSSGNDRLMLQPRDLRLFEKLALLRLLDRRQIEVLANFHSRSRANVRLAKLRRAGLVVRYFTATSTGSRRAVYGLTKRGAAMVGMSLPLPKWKPDSALYGNAFAAHTLAIADTYIAACTGRQIGWQTFSEPVTAMVPLVPDAFMDGGRALFLEVDLGTEPLPVWSRKAALYLRLAATGAFREITDYPHFAVLVVAENAARLESLRRHIARQTSKLFWFATLEIIQRQGFWSSCWLRATGDDLSQPGA